MSATLEITGIFCHPRTIGSRAVSLLIDLIEGQRPPPETIIVPTELNIRRSTLRNGTG